MPQSGEAWGAGDAEVGSREEVEGDGEEDGFEDGLNRRGDGLPSGF